MQESNLYEVTEVKGRDEKVFENILNSLSPRLFNIALAILKNRQDAEDALQETFLKVYMNMHKIRKTNY